MIRISSRQLLVVISCLPLFASSVVAMPLMQQKQSYRHVVDTKNHEQMEDVPSHHASLYNETPRRSFLPVVYLSIINSLINVLRPDRAIIWQARVPRALWEICIAIVATSANNTSNQSVCLLLCLMMVPTAFMDIFLWAPSFAMFANFETCTGGGIFSRLPKECNTDYVKGIGRLFVTVQSLVTGVVYLLAAVMSWTVFAESRDTSIARKNAIAMAETMQSTRMR